MSNQINPSCKCFCGCGNGTGSALRLYVNVAHRDKAKRKRRAQAERGENPNPIAERLTYPDSDELSLAGVAESILAGGPSPIWFPAAEAADWQAPPGILWTIEKNGTGRMERSL